MTYHIQRVSWFFWFRPQGSDPDFSTAWKCVDLKKSKDPAALTAFLDELGVSEQEEFEVLTRKDFEAIAILLKPASEKLFRKALNLTE